MAIYAIGDIQGCYDEFVALLEKIQFSEKDDTLWIAGDLVNRGPKSLAVLEHLMQLGDNVQCVLGNHDLHLLAIVAGVRPPNRKDTLDCILNSPKLHDIVDWLRVQPLLHHDAALNISMVHAGIPPIWSLAQAQHYAEEVSSILSSDHWQQFTQNMYGNEPSTWHKGLEGMDRLRTITNYLTRMRFCTAEGELDLIDKASRNSSRPGFDAWFTFTNPQLPNDHQLLFGHWAALEGDSESPSHHALDTGCVWGGTLTAMNVITGRRYSVAASECEPSS